MLRCALTVPDIADIGGRSTYTPTIQVVTTRGEPPKATRAGTTSGRSDTREDVRVRHYAPAAAISRLRVAFSGVVVRVGNTEANMGNNYTAECAVERSSPVDNNQFLFSGATTKSITPGNLFISDELTLSIPAGQTFYTRTGLTTAAAADLLPMAANPWTSGSGDFKSLNPEVTSQVPGTGAMTNPGTGIITADTAVPYLILGFPATPTPAVAIFGDSIANGQDDAQVASPYGGRGYITRGLENATAGKIPYTNFAVQSNRFQYDTAAGGASKRLTFPYFTHAIIELGTNDFGTGGRTLAQVKADMLAMAAELKAVTGPYGKKIHVAVCKLLPRILTSTDSYATVAGQTAYYNAAFAPGGDRDLYNTWLDTQVGVTIDSVINPNTYVEYSGGNKWAVAADVTAITGTTNYNTADGTHLRTQGAINASAAVTAWANALSV